MSEFEGRSGFSESKKFTYVDSVGKSHHNESLNKSNCREILNYIILNEPDSVSHEKRCQILGFKEGEIKSYEAFIDREYFRKNGRPDPESKDFWTCLHDPLYWEPQRREEHAAIIQTQLQLTRELSEKLGQNPPTIYLLRGNTAAGKTTGLQKIKVDRLDEIIKNDPRGIINPDDIDFELRKFVISKGISSITYGQFYEEASVISRKVEETVLDDPGLSVIVDRRFTYTGDIEEICLEAIKVGKKVRIFDIDTPLELSADRVLHRDPKGVSPCVMFKVLSDGFEQIKLNRSDLIKFVNSSMGKVELYVLYEGSDGLVEIGRKKAGSPWKYKLGKDKFDEMVHISPKLVLKQIKEAKDKFEKAVNEHARKAESEV